MVCVIRIINRDGDQWCPTWFFMSSWDGLHSLLGNMATSSIYNNIYIYDYICICQDHTWMELLEFQQVIWIRICDTKYQCWKSSIPCCEPDRRAQAPMPPPPLCHPKSDELIIAAYHYCFLQVLDEKNIWKTTTSLWGSCFSNLGSQPFTIGYRYGSKLARSFGVAGSIYITSFIDQDSQVSACPAP